MRRGISIKVFVYLLVFFLSVSVHSGFVFANEASSSYQDQPIYKIAVLNNVPPYMWEEAGKARGADVEVVRELSRRSGMKFEFYPMPLKRVMAWLKNGKVHFSIGFRTPEREKFADYLDLNPVHWSEYKVYVKSGEEQAYSGIESLYGKTVGKNRGFAISGQFDQAAKEKKFSLVGADNFSSLINMLMASRVDAIAVNPVVLAYGLNQMNIALNQVAELPDLGSGRKGSYLLASKSAKFDNRLEVYELLEKTLAEMIRDGEIERIEKRYPRFSLPAD